ncbi:putative aminopeptidase [Microdochium trichocladiopsis]|uniref:Aminopeptidase n=1 Tax=Microdochium trichocladiopsis TaxID=1682393 RepID=A0A9P9BUF2_9PEZI|nr:putative aminopeptidase [Microdochium trichocladiopsis]KAH7038067.1 putative aminopeptidase [Microdochium trichocladiopsis]
MSGLFRDELELVQTVVRAAAGLSQSLLRSDDKGVLAKDDLSPVTVADFAIQGLLCASIHARFPTDHFVGEESADDLRGNSTLLNRVWELLSHASTQPSSNAVTLPRNPEHMCELIDMCGHGAPGGPGSGRVWIFDPIDGTQTFVRGEAYAINVALLVDGQQVLSVIGCPTLPASSQEPVHNATIDPTGQGLLIYGTRGNGVYIAPLLARDSDGQVDMHPSSRKLDAHAATATRNTLRSVSCFNLLDSGVEDIHRAVMEDLNVPLPGCDLLGWVPRWVTLALGLANVTVWVYKRRDRHGKVWDHAGAMMLFEELGGKITDIDGVPIDLTVGRKMTANHGFVAAPAHLHSLVLETLQSTLRREGKDHLLASK